MSTTQRPAGEALPTSDAAHAGPVHLLVDLNVCLCASIDSVCECVPHSAKYRRVEKDLYLHSAQRSAWLLVATTPENALTSDNLVLTDVRTEEPEMSDAVNAENEWEERSCGLWVMRSKYSPNRAQSELSYLTDIDVLFGADAVDPRPRWNLMDQPLQLPKSEPKLPAAGSKVKMPIRAFPRLTIRHLSSPSTDLDGPQLACALRAREDGSFRIVQITDTHMVTGVGASRDALDARGNPLPASEADPRTVQLIGSILDTEKPDLVVFTGDQVHHNIHDTQSALFKVVAPIIERRIPWAAVFGNHDDEGDYAMSREEQMSLLQGLPYSLCQPGPEEVDGVGNYYLSIFPHHYDPNSSAEVAVATIFCIDTHGEVSSDVKHPDYDWVKQSQIDWFTKTSQSLKDERKATSRNASLVFLHIPVPEYGDDRLVMQSGTRREPTEGPSHNSHFYDALVDEGIHAVGCGHDHGNDFCGLLPRVGGESDSGKKQQFGPWLCYGGAGGYGGYGSYGGVPFYRQSRIWEIDTKKGGLKTWRRREYVEGRVDELVLVEAGTILM